MSTTSADRREQDRAREGDAQDRHLPKMLADLSPRTRKLLLGDWGTVIRDPLDLLRLLFIAAAIGYAIGQEWGQAARLAATGVVVYVPRYLDLPRPFDLGFIVGMSLQAFGNVFGLFQSTDWWDLLVHFVLTGFIAVAIYIGISRNTELLRTPGEVVRRGDGGRAVIAVVAIGAVVDAIYEAYEWVVDQLFGTNLYKGWVDTVTDWAVAVGGSLVAGIFLVGWIRRGWGATRRPDGERLSEPSG